MKKKRKKNKGRKSINNKYVSAKLTKIQKGDLERAFLKMLGGIF